MNDFEYRRLISDGEVYSETLLGGFPTYLIEYLRLTRDTGFLPAFIGISQVSAIPYEKENLRHLLSHLVSRGIRISKKKLLSGLISQNSG